MNQAITKLALINAIGRHSGQWKILSSPGQSITYAVTENNSSLAYACNSCARLEEVFTVAINLVMKHSCSHLILAIAGKPTDEKVTLFEKMKTPKLQITYEWVDVETAAQWRSSFDIVA